MELIEYQERFLPQIKSYYFEDTTYSRSPYDAVRQAKGNSDQHPILCFENKELVTFFILDEGKDKFDYTKNAESMLLRSFSTDSDHLRKGYAKKALNLLPGFVKAQYPSAEEIILGVNEKNAAAINLYNRAGFQDTGRKYLGKKGYQLVLALPLIQKGDR